MDYEEFMRRFDYHRPSGEARELHEEVRVQTKEFAALMDETLDSKGSRELALFWTNFEQATFWLHAHIARNMPHEEEADE